jgi:hypothetical protein
MRRERPTGSRRRKRQLRSQRQFFIAIAGVAVFLVAAGAIWLQVRDMHPALNADTFCPLSRAPSEEHVILIDVTDAWTPIQGFAIRQEIRQIQDALPRFARVHLYVLDRARVVFPEPDLELCNPGRPDQIEELPLLRGSTAAVVANPDQMWRRWEDGFVSQMETLLDRAAAGTGAERSHIMETVRTAAVRAFNRPRPDSPPRYVHVFSDLLQHSDTYSHYRHARWTPEDAKRLADPGMLGTPSMEGAQVIVYLVDRQPVGTAPGRSRSELVTFWDTFMSAQGAAVMRVRRIEG